MLVFVRVKWLSCKIHPPQSTAIYLNGLTNSDSDHLGNHQELEPQGREHCD